MKLHAKIERWPVAGAFTISRGAKTHVDVVAAEIIDGDHVGRGEGTAIYYHGESAGSVLAQVLAQADAIDAGLTRADLQALLPRGAARNALDSALWDLAAKKADTPVWRLAGLGTIGYVDGAVVAASRDHEATKTRTRRAEYFREGMQVVRRHTGRVPWHWCISEALEREAGWRLDTRSGFGSRVRAGGRALASYLRWKLHARQAA